MYVNNWNIFVKCYLYYICFKPNQLEFQWFLYSNTIHLSSSMHWGMNNYGCIVLALDILGSGKALLKIRSKLTKLKTKDETVALLLFI